VTWGSISGRPDRRRVRIRRRRWAYRILGSSSSSESKVEGVSPSGTWARAGGVEELEGTLRELFWEKGLAEGDVGCRFNLDVGGLGMAGVGREVNEVPHRIEVEG